MQILRDRDVIPSPGLRFHRETSWFALIAAIVLSVVVAAVAAFLTVTQAWASTWAIVGFAVWSAIMALPIHLCFRTFRASRRPESWRLAWTPDFLYLRFRSFQNYRFDPETPSVVAIPRREVAWIRNHTRLLESQDGDGNWSTRHKIRTLQIKLKASVKPAPLSEALKAEAARRDRKGIRYVHYPVTLHADAILHVELRRPATLLEQLRRYYPTTMDETAPLKHFRDMTREQKETHILDLLLAGQKVDAIKAAREVYGYDLATARKLVEELVER